jgi:hypothetical protein
VWSSARVWLRVSAEGVVVSGVLPVAVAVRRPGRLLVDSSTWLIKRCPYCQGRHVHRADPVLSQMALPAKCGEGDRAYLVQEVADVRADA